VKSAELHEVNSIFVDFQVNSRHHGMIFSICYVKLKNNTLGNCRVCLCQCRPLNTKLGIAGVFSEALESENIQTHTIKKFVRF